MRKLATLTAAAALLATSANAQWARGFGRGWAPGQATTAQSRHEQRLNFLATYLNLNEGQKAQFKAALDALLTKTQATVQQAQQLHVKLRDAVRNNAAPATIQSLAAELAKLHTELITARAQTMSTLRNLLTPEQRAKLDSLCPVGCGFGWGGGLGCGRGRGPRW